MRANQDSLFTAEDGKIALPTFNTNAIEVNLWRIPNLTEVFLHINDDYIFGSSPACRTLADSTIVFDCAQCAPS